MKISRRENLINVLKGGEGEKVPFVPFVGVHAAKVLEVGLKDFLSSSDLIAKGVVKSAKLYNADGIPLCFDLQIEAELLGCGVKYLDKMPPAVIKHPLAKGSLSDLNVYEPNSGRLKCVLDAIESIRAELGDNTALYALVSGVLTLAYQLRGRALLEDIANRADSLIPLLAYCRDIQLKTIKAYAERGVDVVAVVEPLCSNLDIDFFKELLPFENDLFDYINDLGLLSSFFLCGDVNELLDEICESRCHNISVCSNVNLSVLREKALKAKKSFGGNLNPRSDILNCSKEETILKTKQCLDIGKTKAFVFSTGCDLAFDSPSESLIAISQVISNYLKKSQ
ncbi:MAG: uroporphyrinogen decarboxylase family protein [Opitutales bacterium]